MKQECPSTSLDFFPIVVRGDTVRKQSSFIHGDFVDVAMHQFCPNASAP